MASSPPDDTALRIVAIDGKGKADDSGTDHDVIVLDAGIDPADVTLHRDGERYLAPGISDNSRGLACAVGLQHRPEGLLAAVTCSGVIPTRPGGVHPKVRT